MQLVLNHVTSCRDLCHQLPSRSSDPTLPLLALYELEARLALSSPDTDGVMETVAGLTNVEPKTYETIAGRSQAMWLSYEMVLLLKSPTLPSLPP